jgi:hypothetical protein
MAGALSIALRFRPSGSCVPTVEGGTVDLTRYPTPSGFEGLVCFVGDQRKDVCFSSVSVPAEGYLYFQLKNQKHLAETVFWMSNGGRHYPPGILG